MRCTNEERDVPGFSLLFRTSSNLVDLSGFDFELGPTPLWRPRAYFCKNV